LLRRELQTAAPGVLNVVLKRALKGDPAMAKLFLTHCMPPMKPESQPVEVSLPTGAGLGDQARAILERVAAGELSPTAAAELLGALSAAAHVIETGELEKRMADIERLLAADRERL
jgi:hypothetical protein